jgi:hypothetical protein
MSSLATKKTTVKTVDPKRPICYNTCIETKKEQKMTTTVADLIRQLQAMPQDAGVILRGSYETYDGYSHPCVELDADGEVVIREADEEEV